MDAQKLIAEIYPQVQLQVAEELRTRVLAALGHEADVAMREQVRAYFAETLAPIIAQELQDRKSEIIAQVVSAIQACGAELGAAIMSKFTENTRKSLESGYVLKEIIEKLLRGY